MSRDPYTEATALFPRLGRYRKLIVSLLATATPYLLWLTGGPHPLEEIIAATFGYLLANFGVFRLPNDPG